VVRTTPGRKPVNFLFVCWWCEADCSVYGKPAGFWRELYRVPDEWDCWWCGRINETPPPPWTPDD
jgi:hypothetical protein